jgi:DNA-binding MarR family transcriptional regulator
MSDLEFEVLDQLYFVIGLEELSKEMQMSQEELWSVLRRMIDKGWVKVMQSQSDEELELSQISEIALSQYVFLATKKGLLAHNSR